MLTDHAHSVSADGEDRGDYRVISRGLYLRIRALRVRLLQLVATPPVYQSWIKRIRAAIGAV